ncbi:MAG: 23S rRNA (uracil(1939)-C(5))-methyltransferase RlmD [Clostridia bacterium]|nr:23S rRNA (uracil(1939)-C(5))-methyltransferase RlmD [Clostridia bacterium]
MSQLPPKTMPRCPLSRKCGGCQLQNMDYPRQLKYKQETVVSLLGKYHHVKPILGMERPYHYRNKVQAAFGLTRGGEVVSGVYQSSSHRIVKVDSCQIEDPAADRIVVTIRKMLPSFRILPYNEDSRRGFLRHVLVRRGFTSGQIMVVFVGASPMFPLKKKFTEELLRRHPEITTVVLNINPQRTSMLLGEREEVLFGRGFIEDTLCGCTFRISPRSFYQINPLQTERLYRTALDMAQLKPTDRVLDAYCGVGTIGIVAARQAGQVVGVELNGDAVRDARVNARRNGLENIAFMEADAGEYMVKLARSGEKVDVVLMDPPRAGSDIPFLESLLTLAPARVVYISCNPETQARDLRVLTKGGYRVTGIQPVDMFPHTSHIECVVLLVKAHPAA